MAVFVFQHYVMICWLSVKKRKKALLWFMAHYTLLWSIQKNNYHIITVSCFVCRSEMFAAQTVPKILKKVKKELAKAIAAIDNDGFQNIKWDDKAEKATKYGDAVACVHGYKQLLQR